MRGCSTTWRRDSSAVPVPTGRDPTGPARPPPRADLVAAGDDDRPAGNEPGRPGERTLDLTAPAPGDRQVDLTDATTQDPPRPPTPRVWRGIPRDERVQERRQRLLAAGLEVFGTVGVRGATVGAVCQQAHLTQRYFYESFPSLKALLVAVFTSVTERQHAEMAAAALEARTATGSRTEAARAALVVYFTALQADPRVARVQLLEILGSDRGADRSYQAAIRRAGDLVLHVGQMREVARPAVPRLLALGLIGAVVEIATIWLLSDFADPLEAVVGSALVIFDAVIQAEQTPDPARAARLRPTSPLGGST